MSDELVKRVAALEREVAALKAQVNPEPFIPRPMPRFDPTEGMRMPPDAAQKMAAVIHGKDVKYDKDAWARSRLGQPGGFGGPPERTRLKERDEGGGWHEPPGLEGQIKGRWSK